MTAVLCAFKDGPTSGARFTSCPATRNSGACCVTSESTWSRSSATGGRYEEQLLAFMIAAL